ncbi:MAG: phthiocerol/phenolphthiocerol synthesis type-I polyketide synthase [Acidobacteriota bacterium]|nr:phthiocerol/phenolphthiocerol synthesis type-I polyketide synthase [Acidobacteriota bacterium]
MKNDENAEKIEDLNGVAIIGMAGRFPGAKNIDEFWRNLENGVECIKFYTEEELREAGIAPEVLKNPYYMKAKGEVGDVDMFDASFFAINPREAEVTDPQHRMLLECAWEAMENAGYDSSKYDGLIGMYAGKSMDYYLLLNVFPRIKKEISSGSLQAAIGNDKDSLTTTIAYRMNLMGPVITIQTSSSTSLVAVCVACQSLLTYQCDIALAGGITAGPPIRSGYLFQSGGIWSDDGHTRAFDAKSTGFVPGAGMGLVTLKRLEDALADHDNIWAVIRGFAVNNDGCNKVSYAAPSVDAQAQVVAQAIAAAGIHPETISYIETHGTGTNLGDPIEMTALTQAFRTFTDKKQFCAIGSTKTNIGHLDNAAGIAGLIKASLALKNKKIPASLHFETPNPKIDFDNSPFFVNTKLREWKTNGFPRRAGVTSLGMGGTNAHVIVEEAPEKEPSGASRPEQLVFLSAKTNTALDKLTENLAAYLKDNADLNLADSAYSLGVGRRDFNYRRAVLCRLNDAADTAAVLEKLTPGRVFNSVCTMTGRPVVFMFSGQGAQYVNMAAELYKEEPVFRGEMDRCFEILAPILGYDIKEILFPASDPGRDINQTEFTQPLLFIIEYSLARLLIDWGIVPAGMIGHSIGEFAAACISGCMSLEDTLRLVAARGRLMQETAPGTMLSVGMNETGISQVLAEYPELSLAAVNSPTHCVVSGKTEAIEKLEKQLAQQNQFNKRLKTSHAFHSPLMEPIMDKFAETAAKVKINGPKIPFISGVTGTWITAEEIGDKRYWVNHLRKPVRFAAGIEEILKDPNRLLLEVGPGNSLCVLAAEQKKSEKKTGEFIFSSIRHIKQTDSDLTFLLKALANLWLSGVTIDWKNYYKNEKRFRIPLPTYPFERKRYWLEEMKQSEISQVVETRVGEDQEIQASESTVAAPVEKTGQIEGEKTFQPRPELNNEYIPPTTDTERKVAEMWEDLLGIKPVGLNDNFFDLGGHSLLATLFLSRVQDEFQIRLELRTIFEEPIVANLAALIDSERNKELDVQKIEDLIKEVEGLSPEEIRSTLGENPIE